MSTCRCRFCETAAPDLAAAARDGWEPSYYDGETQIPEPVCPTCSAIVLRTGADGETELLPGVRVRRN